MRKIVLLLFLLSICLTDAFCQTEISNQKDVIHKHNGEILQVQVKEITSANIKFSFPGESLIQNIGKPAVAKIVYGSGREEIVSEYVSLKNDSDFEKIVILTSKDETIGLVDKGEVVGKTAAISYQTPGTANKASLNRIRKAALKLNAPFILIEDVSHVGLGMSGQSIRRGRAFGYK